MIFASIALAAVGLAVVFYYAHVTTRPRRLLCRGRPMGAAQHHQRGRAITASEYGYLVRHLGGRLERDTVEPHIMAQAQANNVFGTPFPQQRWTRYDQRNK